MVQILDSDWSRENFLRSDWSGPRVAIYTTGSDMKIVIEFARNAFY